MGNKIVIIGAGNLATHLSVALQNFGYEILQVYSRTEESAKQLAIKLEVGYTTSINNILPNADFYFVALKDSAINEVLSQIDFQNKLLVHCSGSLHLSVLKEYSENTGVLYPLQTFSKKRLVNFKAIPVFVEANTESNEQKLLAVANHISDKVTHLNSENRKALHIAAVFACNFANHMYSLAAQFLESKEIDFEVLRPLILETAEKVQELQPKDAQTGPAIRFDENIINAHLNELKDKPDLQELYNSISKSIFEHHQEKE